MECQECPEGFKVHYTPMAPGNYIITIKYGGPNHITGSPFKAKVTGVCETELNQEDPVLVFDENGLRLLFEVEVLNCSCGLQVHGW